MSNKRAVEQTGCDREVTRPVVNATMGKSSLKRLFQVVRVLTEVDIFYIPERQGI